MTKRINKLSNFVKFPTLEAEISQFWKDNGTFKASLENRIDAPRWRFIDGPPFVSGIPHYASLLPSIAKDIIPRYQTMKGNYVRRVFGWDCHGLPIEEQVSKKFELKNSEAIEEFGVDKYIAECRNFVNSTTDQWQEYIEKIGRWADMENAYYTMNPEFNESVLWFFKTAWDKKLIYKGKRVSLYSVDNQTPVSEFEINMDADNYRDVKDIAIYVKFPVKTAVNDDLIGANILIWTTTPWTIPANLCVAFNEGIEYVLVEFEGEKYILAKSRLESVFSTDESHIGAGKGFLVNIIRKVDIEELQTISYTSVYNYLPQVSLNYTLYPASYVTDTDGTGLVHIAGAYGKEDYDLCKEHGVEIFESISKDGRMLYGRQQGKHMRSALKDIVDEINEKGNLFSSAQYVHRLPFYRGSSPLVYMAQDSYFIDIQSIKPRMLELNKKMNWYPNHFGSGRFADVVENAPDWCISRTRYWATIMPLWIAEDGEELVCGSIEEMAKYYDGKRGDLKKNAEDGVWMLNGEKLFLHRDMCDKIELIKDSKTFKRSPFVLDCWLDSGVVPFAEFSYPFRQAEHPEIDVTTPADFIVEYTGQLRAWFNIILRVAVIAFDKEPFINSIVTGNLAGNDGRKMSKSFKNFPDPLLTLNNIGGEALRLYMMGSSIMNGEDSGWSDELLNDQVKNILIPFWNTFTYFTIYADSHNYIPENSDFIITGNILDSWLKTRVEKAVKEYDLALSQFDLPASVKIIRPVIDDISTWYIRRSRDRFASGNKDAIQNLYAALCLLIKTFAPQMPFITEKMYQEIVVGILPNAKPSIHIEDYPDTKSMAIDEELLIQMQEIRNLCSKGLAIRTESGRALKQPLAACYTNLKDEHFYDILKAELNVKKVEYKEKKEGTENPELFVELDTVLTTELQDEGILADVQRKIQNTRKVQGLVMGQQAILSMNTQSEEVKQFITKYKQELCKATVLKDILFQDAEENSGDKVKLLGIEVSLKFEV
jgi:isoleucyl-tRNA synthetase